ncbi:hypothetical protein GN956_G19196 [Arapaima gigas]
MAPCGCGTSSGVWIKIFGSGTQLIVTDKDVKEPDVSTYLPVTLQDDQTSALVCVASGMFPDVVRFKWKKKINNQVTDLPSESALQQQDQDRVTSIMLTKKDDEDVTYTCSVEHEKSGQKDFLLPKKGDTKTNALGTQKPSCQPKQTENGTSTDLSGYSSLEGKQSLKDLNLVATSYTVFLIKSMAYFGIVSVIMYKRSGRSC